MLHEHLMALREYLWGLLSRGSAPDPAFSSLHLGEGPFEANTSEMGGQP